MIKPMLAASMADATKKNTITNWKDWVAEVKYDGIRLMVDNTGLEVKSFTRTRDGLPFDLPKHVKDQFTRLAPGWYDGELLGGETSTDVKRLDLRHTLIFVVFDVVMSDRNMLVHRSYDDRHVVLERTFAKAKVDSAVLMMSTRMFPTCREDLTRWVKTIWKTGGEGVILKKRSSAYLAGERRADAWVKVKKVEHATLTLVGFLPSKGTVRFVGHPFAIVKLRDDEGNETTAKVVNDFELRRIEAAWSKEYGEPFHLTSKQQREWGPHPWVNKRKVVIEFQQRTRDGGYRGPVLFDRWEDE